MTAKPKTVAEYIAIAPKEGRARLREMRILIKKCAPGAVEAIKWGLPSFSYTRLLVAYGAFKHHIGFYPTPLAIKSFAKEMKMYPQGRGSVQFPYDKPLPLALIKKMTLLRVKESLEADVHWRSPRAVVKKKTTAKKKSLVAKKLTNTH